MAQAIVFRGQTAVVVFMTRRQLHSDNIQILCTNDGTSITVPGRSPQDIRSAILQMGTKAQSLAGTIGAFAQLEL